MFYSPFNDKNGNMKRIYQIEYNDLEQLFDKEIEEGYKIEYKRELSTSVKKKLPRIITSFSNEKGGWLFIGIDEIKKEIRLLDMENYEVELMINNKLKDTVSPVPEVIIRFLTPDTQKSKGVIVINVPEGKEPPYLCKGQIYRRIGSGSSLVKNKYFLNKLYEKSEKYVNELNEFCQKDINIKNEVQSNIVHYRNLGMCHIYLIPTKEINLQKYIFDYELEEKINTISKKMHKISNHETDNEFSFEINMPFVNGKYTNKSIIYRNNTLLDSYNKKVAWEQFFNGRAKFHFPIPYVKDNSNVINDLSRIIENYNNERVFDDFDYIDGYDFLENIMGCMITYQLFMNESVDIFDESIIVIDFDDVRNSVLYFDNKHYKEIIKEKGLNFSDKKKYRINGNFKKQEFSDSLFDILIAISKTAMCFGLHQQDAMEIFIQELINNNK